MPGLPMKVYMPKGKTVQHKQMRLGEDKFLVPGGISALLISRFGV